MYLNFVLNGMFWVTLASLISAIALIGYIYKVADIRKSKLLFFGVLLILSASTMMLGIKEILKDVDFWLPDVQNDSELTAMLHIKVICNVLQYVVPLSIAAIGSFCITKAMDARLSIY